MEQFQRQQDIVLNREKNEINQMENKIRSFRREIEDFKISYKE